MQQKIGVKFKIGSKIYSFLGENLNLKVGDSVVVETFLGEGYGKVDKIENYDPTKENQELKKVIRKATKEDEEQYNKMLEKERCAIAETKNIAEKLKLDMNVVNAEFSLDGTKVVIDFIAEDRIDFRDLVKELATKLKSRIELRQIGIRDQAKMVGGIGICGRVCCCASYLKDFEKVSIKMAKSQGLALNPTKISGSCGRLMCCLAYEDNYYSEIYPKIPKINKEVQTPDGIGVVQYTNALKQIVSVKISAKDGSFIIKDYSLDDISNVEVAQNQSSIQDYKNFNKENLQQKNNDVKLQNTNKNNQQQTKIENKNVNNKINQNNNNNNNNDLSNSKNNIQKNNLNNNQNNKNKSGQNNNQTKNENQNNKKQFNKKHKNKNFKNNQNQAKN